MRKLDITKSYKVKPSPFSRQKHLQLTLPRSKNPARTHLSSLNLLYPQISSYIFEMATEYQQYSNFPGDFQNDLDALSASIYDDDLIPILDREDNSDLSHYESSRCSSLSGPSSEWICPLRDNVPSCNQLFGNVAYQIPRAPPPTPLVASPSVLPMLYNEENEEIPAFELSTSLKELGVCAAMGNAQTWWSMANAEDTKFSNLEDTSKVSSFPSLFF